MASFFSKSSLSASSCSSSHPPRHSPSMTSTQRPPKRASELLAMFGARASPKSASRLGQTMTQSRGLESRTASASASVSGTFSDLTSPITVSPATSVASDHVNDTEVIDLTAEDSTWKASANVQVIELDSSDELQDDEDTIHVVPRGFLRTLETPTRSLRPRPSAVISKSKKPKSAPPASRRKAVPLLISDALHDSVVKQAKPVKQTARNRIRRDIAENTRPRQDAFLLAYKEFFLPLLPQNNYIRRLSARKDPTNQQPIDYSPLDTQPNGVRAGLKPYQLQGLSFLVHMYKNAMPAILGDEMGLGKTLQTLALFQYLEENSAGNLEEARPHLVICPLSVLSSWINEAKRWVPDLNVVRFHGPKQERDKIKQNHVVSRSAYKKGEKPDVFITTYEAFKADHSWFKSAFAWRYCVLDEGHRVKNSLSDLSKVLQSLSAEHRLLLTGTPLQNNLTEMWSLLHWLYPEVFTRDTSDNFKSAFDLTRGKVSTGFMDHARRLLEVIMIRRMKSSPEVNLGLPPKTEVLLYVPLTPMQRFWYERLLTRADTATLDGLFSNAVEKEQRVLAQTEHDSDEKLNHLLATNDAAELISQANEQDVWAESKAILAQALATESTSQADSQWRKLMNLLMQLRKVCSHPYLIPNAAPPDYEIGDHIKIASGKFIVLDKLLEELCGKQRKKGLIFSGFTRTLDFCEDLLVLRNSKSADAPIQYSRLDGSTPRARRNLSIRMFNDPNSNQQVMLLSTRAGGLGINLTSATEVIFMDEDWNPQMTLQAEARAHRIGQTKEFTIYKLCSQGTVEEQMMGRIRKKLYLSAKITESMRNIHNAGGSKKRKRESTQDDAADDGAPHLDTASLQSLIRRGAQTLTRPQIDVTEMLGWDWPRTLEECKDRPLDSLVAGAEDTQVDEQAWLNTMEKVECAVFDGKKLQKRKSQGGAYIATTNRVERREGKNTTIEIDGYMVNKESLLCGDWEAVPTLAGKDPRLAEPQRRKRSVFNHQDFCLCCWDGGELVLCQNCPRSYHVACLDGDFQAKSQGSLFTCPQHECRDCGAKTSDAGGLIYRCRWCKNGFCEDCQDWEKTVLVGDTMPEFEMLDFAAHPNIHFVECSHCVTSWKANPKDASLTEAERRRIEGEYKKYKMR